MPFPRMYPFVAVVLCTLPLPALAAPGAYDPGAVVTRHVAAFAAHDVDGLMSDYADDVIAVLPDTVLQGKAAMRGWFVQFFKASGPPFDAALDRVEGDAGITHWVANPGAPGAVQGYDVFIVRGGKIRFQTSMGVGPVAAAK